MQEELGLLEDTMARLYDEMILIRQVVDPLVCIQKKAQEVVKLLNVENRAVDHFWEWDAKYPNGLQHLEMKDRIPAEIDIVQLGLHHHNYMHIGEQSISTIVSYNELHNGFESLTHKHGMPAIWALEAIKGREITFQEVRKYIEHIKKAIKQKGFEVTKDIILHYAITLIKPHMKLSRLWNNVYSISKTILMEALEVKMRYVGDFPVQVKAISTNIRTWHTYITNKLHEEANDLSIL